MAAWWVCGFLPLLAVAAAGADGAKGISELLIRLSTENGHAPTPPAEEGVMKWFVLIAGSSGCGNYRHQANVSHAYQILKKGGLKDENIVVFMYDDSADSPDNPRRGVVINHPKGKDIYHGVPKELLLPSYWDCTREQVTAKNLYAVLLRTKPRLLEGVGRYAQRTKCLCRRLHQSVSAKACFQKLFENGDLYSVSWMDDSETHNLKKETIKQQYKVVKARTAPLNESSIGSHVMEYGDKTFKGEMLFLYQGFDPTMSNIRNRSQPKPSPKGAIKQRYADILFMWKKYDKLNGGSEEKQRALRGVKETVLMKEICPRGNNIVVILYFLIS
ncbi:hypothetical protein VPH35_038808 [Triticum aestivum]